MIIQSVMITNNTKGNRMVLYNVVKVIIMAGKLGIDQIKIKTNKMEMFSILTTISQTRSHLVRILILNIQHPNNNLMSIK